MWNMTTSRITSTKAAMKRGSMHKGAGYTLGLSQFERPVLRHGRYVIVDGWMYISLTFCISR